MRYTDIDELNRYCYRSGFIHGALCGMLSMFFFFVFLKYIYG
jgi:phytoene/squalene synthetase